MLEITDENLKLVERHTKLNFLSNSSKSLKINLRTRKDIIDKLRSIKFHDLIERI